MLPIIISPSGEFYGSEQVLLEYLRTSQIIYQVCVPKDSSFGKRLSNEGFNIVAFTNLNLLYIKVFCFLLFSKKLLYVNEGGHIRYVKLLAKILPNTQFYVHIRLLEDCSASRLNKLPKNIHIITVSNFLKSNIPSCYPVKVIYDPYSLTNNHTYRIDGKNTTSFTIGIVGRVTRTKGLDSLIPILRELTNNKEKFYLKFFGSIDVQEIWVKKFIVKLEDIVEIETEFVGFVSSKEDIYNNIDVLLHLNKNEALGRILFEAIDYEVPFLSFNRGGCGELANLLNLEKLLIEENNNWVDGFVNKILKIFKNRNVYSLIVKNAKQSIRNNFRPEGYGSSLENFFIK